MVAAHIGEKDGVVAEDVGVLRVGVDGAFIEVLGGIVVAANIGEEAGVVVQEWRESRMFAYRCLIGGEDGIGILLVHRKDPFD